MADAAALSLDAEFMALLCAVIGITIWKRFCKEFDGDEHLEARPELGLAVHRCLAFHARARSNGNRVEFEVNGEALNVPTRRGLNVAVINFASWTKAGLECIWFWSRTVQMHSLAASPDFA